MTPCSATSGTESMCTTSTASMPGTAPPAPLAASRYGNVDVTGVVRRGNVYGTQFHPEKSGDAGLRLLRAFAEL